MTRISHLLLLAFTTLISIVYFEKVSGTSFPTDFREGAHDSVSWKQELYNGRVWRNIYSHRVKGNQFLFTKEFLPGSVTMNGKLFTDLELKYDTYNDELLIVFDNMTILQLNKEMIDMFTLNYGNVLHKFIKLASDSINTVEGFVDVIYDGKTPFYVKNTSEISRLAQGRNYDVFINDQRIYIRKDSVLHYVRREKDLLILLSDQEEQIRHYIRENKIRVSRKVPESFVPVIKFYDSIPQ